MPLSIAQVAQLRVQRDVAQATGRFRKPRRLYIARWPGGVRSRYYIALKQGLDRIESIFRETTLPSLREALDRNARLQRNDAPADDVDEAFVALRSQVSEALPGARSVRLGVQVAAETAQANRQEVGRVFASMLGFDPLSTEAAGIEAQLSTFVRDQVRLIQGLHSGVIDQLHQTVMTGLRNGQRVESLSQEISRRFSVARSRADLIAQDQVGKFNGELTRLRQQHVGVARYRWSTSKDERVRPYHHLLEGTEHRWNDPPITDRKGNRNHPGHDFRCRCVAIPIVDDLLAALGGEEPANQQTPTPRHAPRSIREQQFHALADGFAARTKDGGQASRRAARDFLSRYRLRRIDRPRQDVLNVENMPGNRGYHASTGHVALNPAVDGEAASAFGKLGKDLTEAERMAIKTVMHEEVHGYGLTPFGRPYHRHGKLVEEVATEILARRSSRQLLGLRSVPSTFDLPVKGSTGWVSIPARSGYDAWITAVADALDGVTGWPPERVRRALDRAAVRYKRLTPAEGQTPDSLLEAFVNAIPGMQTTERTALTARLRGDVVTTFRIDGMTLSERLYVLPPFDRDAALALARDWLSEAGDLPEGVFQTLSMTQIDPGAMMRSLDGMRAKHFKSLGKEPPAYSGMLE